MSHFRISYFLAACLTAAVLSTSLSSGAEAQQPEPRYVRPEAVNVRGGPGTGNSIVEVLVLGTEVQVYVTMGNWSRISPPGKPEKWIYAPLLQPEKPAPKGKKPEPAAKSQPAAPASSGKTNKDPVQEKGKRQDTGKSPDSPPAPEKQGDQPKQGNDQPAPPRR